MTRRGHELDEIELVLRVIHTIQQAMTHHRAHTQSRFTGESRCPRQKWIPAFAGKARRRRRASGINQMEGLWLPFSRRPRESGGPGLPALCPPPWMPAFAGTTVRGVDA